MYTCRSTPNLEILNLSGNLLSSLTGRTFEGAGSVRALRLDSNSISEVEGVFHSMDHLTWLNMSGNDLADFDWHFVPYSLRYQLLQPQNITSLPVKLDFLKESKLQGRAK